MNGMPLIIPQDTLCDFNFIASFIIGIDHEHQDNDDTEQPSNIRYRVISLPERSLHIDISGGFS